MKSQLGLTVVEMGWVSALTEYLAAGNRDDGRNGKPWSSVHANQQKYRLEWWGEKLDTPKLTDITLTLVEQAKHQFAGAAKTKLDYVITLGGFLKWARDHKYLTGNPIEHLKRGGKESETEWRALSLDEIKRLLANADASRLLFYQLACCTGMRVGEILALRWRQIDFANQCIRASADDTKNKKKAIQPLPLSIIEKLKGLAAGPDEPILTLPPNYNRGWRDDLEVASVPYETPAGLAVVHSLRKSYTTLLQELAGASLSEAQKLARHSTPALTSNIYTKTSHSKLLSLVDCLGERLLA